MMCFYRIAYKLLLKLASQRQFKNRRPVLVEVRQKFLNQLLAFAEPL